MASRLIVMDESKQRRHRILSVGGVVIELDRLPHSCPVGRDRDHAPEID